MAPKSKVGCIWEDREVLFDLPFTYLKLRAGEKIFDRIEPIEDTKGNSGTKGRMVITNLRLIWHSTVSPRINLSIGLNNILSISTKVVNSGLRGTTQALNIMAAFKSNKYEFIFTNLSPNCVRHYTSAVGVQKAYAASRLYRDIKLRSTMVHNKRLKLLPTERIHLNEDGVWNLSSDTGNLGTMIVTNIRIVWYADVNEGFNASVPFITIEKIAIKDSKFGQALVVSTSRSCGGYVLGFRIDPKERMMTLLQELVTYHEAYTEKPVFGVEINWGTEVEKTPDDEFKDLEEIGEPRGEMGPSLYLASQLAQATSVESEPIYSPYLGLAIEPLKERFTLKNLFEVQTSS